MKRVAKGNKTAFTCLGNWYDLADRESCADLLETLAMVTSRRDKNRAIAEIVDHANTLIEGVADDINKPQWQP